MKLIRCSGQYGEISRLFFKKNAEKRRGFILLQNCGINPRSLRRNSEPAFIVPEFFQERERDIWIRRGLSIVISGIRMNAHFTAIVFYQFQPLFYCHPKIKRTEHQDTNRFTTFHFIYPYTNLVLQKKTLPLHLEYKILHALYSFFYQ